MSKKARKPKKASKQVKPKKTKPRKKQVVAVKRVKPRGKSLLLEDAISSLEGELDNLQQRKRELKRHVTNLKRAVNTLHSREASLRGELLKVKSNEKLSKKEATISSSEMDEIKDRIMKLSKIDEELKDMK